MKIVRPTSIADSGSFTRGSVANYWDKNGAMQSAAINVPRFTFDPADLTAPPYFLKETAATNVLLNSAALSTQSVAVTAIPYTLSFYGTGSVTLSGAATAVSTGTGATARTTLTFTPAAGSLTLTVAGTVSYAQLETGSSASSYITTTGTSATRSADVNTLGYLSPLTEVDYPAIDLTKIYIAGDRIMDASVDQHKVYESATGSTITGTSVSVATPGLVFWVAHGLAVNTPVMFTAGTVPTGLSLNTIYYVATVTDVNHFSVSSTLGGSAIATTGSVGSGVTVRAGSNYNKSPLSYPDIWLSVSSTNKWNLLNATLNTQTVATDFLGAVFNLGSSSLVDSVVLQNIENANAVRVTMVDPTEGVVYNKVVSLISDSGITDPYLYSFEPIVRLTDVAFTDLPPYASAQIAVTLIGIGASVKCGMINIGQSRNFGPTQAGLSLGIQDYGVNKTDDFGNTTFVQRTYARRMNLSAWVDLIKMDALINLLNSYRSTPAVYIGSESYNSTIIYGVFKEYNQGIDYDTVGVLHIEIQGQT